MYNLQPPVLTLLAVEEPENHISPHLLGRIMKALTDVSENDNAQVLVATHSPSMIKELIQNQFFILESIKKK
ncbi:AAA family ATPase [Bacillus velezensis]|nr:AAA family ATPase [Bacillus velezensis]